MSRGRPPKSTSPVRAAHTEFVAALAGNAPRPIHSEANSEDLEGRADHLQKVFAALHVYAHRDRRRNCGEIFRLVPSIAATSTAYSNSFRQTRWG